MDNLLEIISYKNKFANNILNTYQEQNQEYVTTSHLSYKLLDHSQINDEG